MSRALADAIGTLRADPALAQRLTKQALADAQTELSVERYLQRMTQEIRQSARQLWRCGMPMRTPHSMPARAG
jgi:hypothetical protein